MDVSERATPAPRVWVVDDSPADMERTAEALADRYAVASFDDGSAVLERIAAEGPPEALVLDWVMPGVSGIEVIKFLRARPGPSATVPILLLTGRGRPEQISEGLAVGANDYLAKPFAPEELNARLDALLRTAALLSRALDAEQAVRELLAGSPDALFAVDRAGTVAFVNREASRVFDREEAALLGRPVGELLGDLPVEHLVGAQLAGDLVVGERTYAPSARVLPTGDFRTVITLRDVTERRRSEARRLDLYSIVAHDLRSPLGAMMLRSQMMLDGHRGPVSGELRGDIERMVKGSGSMLSTIDDFLAIAELDAAQTQTVERTAVDLGAVIDAVIDDLAPLAEAKRIVLDLRRPSESLVVIGDRTRLGQVIANLVGNAIKFAPEGTTVEISGAAIDDWFEIVVVDRGPGVAQEAIPTLFDRFTRAGDRRAAPGTGLGLMIVRQIVEAHDGTVGVESVVGKGSRFWLRLPRYQPARIELNGGA